MSESTSLAETDYQVFEAGHVPLLSGRTFKHMRLAYKTFGTLNADKSNVIVYPTSYSAQHFDTQFMVGDAAALDASRYFIVIPNLFGNGLSSSPSNTPWPDVGTRYPDVTYFDAVQVQVQQRLLAEGFGIHKVALVYGWSMGAMQAYHWAAIFPDRVHRALTARRSLADAAIDRRFRYGRGHVHVKDSLIGWERGPPGLRRGRWSPLSHEPEFLLRGGPATAPSRGAWPSDRDVAPGETRGVNYEP